MFLFEVAIFNYTYVVYVIHQKEPITVSFKLLLPDKIHM